MLIEAPYCFGDASPAAKAVFGLRTFITSTGKLGLSTISIAAGLIQRYGRYEGVEIELKVLGDESIGTIDPSGS